jgi:hypothetical protein
MDDFDDLETYELPLIPTDDAAVIRRVKAVAATRPLHDLERNKSSYEGDFWDRYDLLSLAVAAIDQVALAMGVSAGILYDDAVSCLAVQASRQQPGDTDGIWGVVACRVLDGLISDSPHETVYAALDGDITERRVHPFRLLYEQWAADDTVHLRASETAINVLVDALDLDVMSAQIAAEVQMRVLIERNALAGAVAVARRARYQSIQHRGGEAGLQAPRGRRSPAAVQRRRWRHVAGDAPVPHGGRRVGRGQRHLRGAHRSRTSA